MSRFLAALVAVTAGLLALPERAAACSCAVGDPRQMLREADAAFVGTLVARHVERQDGRLFSSGDPAMLVFRVEEAVKGDLGELVEVETAASGASCGIEAPVGQRIGLFLTRTSGGWASSLCQQIDPSVLLAAAATDLLPNEPGGITDARPLYSALEDLISLLRPLCAPRLLAFLRY